MIIYTVPDDSVDDIWTKAGLISIREFERKVLADADFKKSCVANPAPGGSIDTVFCDNAKSLFTPLSILPDKNNLETMTEQQVKQVLIDTMAN